VIDGLGRPAIVRRLQPLRTGPGFLERDHGRWLPRGYGFVSSLLLTARPEICLKEAKWPAARHAAPNIAFQRHHDPSVRQARFEPGRITRKFRTPNKSQADPAQASTGFTRWPHRKRNNRGKGPKQKHCVVGPVCPEGKLFIDFVRPRENGTAARSPRVVAADQKLRLPDFSGHGLDERTARARRWLPTRASATAESSPPGDNPAGPDFQEGQSPAKDRNASSLRPYRNPGIPARNE